MISNPRHGSPPRLMAHQPTRCSTTQESSIRVLRPDPVSCPFPPREIGRFGRGLAWRAALIGPGLEPAFDDRQQTLKRVGHALLLKPGDLMAHLDLEGLGDLSCAVASAPP